MTIVHRRTKTADGNEGQGRPLFYHGDLQRMDAPPVIEVVAQIGQAQVSSLPGQQGHGELAAAAEGGHDLGGGHRADRGPARLVGGNVHLDAAGVVSRIGALVKQHLRRRPQLPQVHGDVKPGLLRTARAPARSGIGRIGSTWHQRLNVLQLRHLVGHIPRHVKVNVLGLARRQSGA